MNNCKTKEEAYKAWHAECADLYPKPEWTQEELQLRLIGAIGQITTMGEEVINQKFKNEDWKEKLKEAIIHVRFNASSLSDFQSSNLARALEEFGRVKLGLTDGIFADPGTEGSIASLRSKTEINYLNALMNIIEECAPDINGKYDRERQLWNIEQYAKCALDTRQKFIPFPENEEEIKNLDFFKSVAETTLKVQESTGLPNSEDRVNNLAKAMYNAYEMGQHDKSNEQPAMRRTGFIRRLRERRYHNRRGTK